MVAVLAWVVGRGEGDVVVRLYVYLHFCLFDICVFINLLTSLILFSPLHGQTGEKTHAHRWTSRKVFEFLMKTNRNCIDNRHETDIE